MIALNEFILQRFQPSRKPQDLNGKVAAIKNKHLCITVARMQSSHALSPNFSDQFAMKTATKCRFQNITLLTEIEKIKPEYYTFDHNHILFLAALMCLNVSGLSWFKAFCF